MRVQLSQGQANLPLAFVLKLCKEGDSQVEPFVHLQFCSFIPDTSRPGFRSAKGGCRFDSLFFCALPSRGTVNL